MPNHLSDQSCSIHVLFLETTSKDHWLNRLTANIGGKLHGKGFCHVEICVPSSDGSHYISSSIYNGEAVSMSRVKTFANPGYVVHTETISKAKLASMREIMSEYVRRQVGFDSLGMYLAILPFPTPLTRGSSRTFCSRYVTELLQMAGLVTDLDPIITTPSKLFHRLKQSVDVGTIGTVEYKRASLMKDVCPPPPPSVSRSSYKPLQSLFTID